jgi:serine protease
MKRNYIVLICFLVGLSFTVNAQVSDHTRGDLLVMLKPNASVEKLIESQQQYARMATELKVVRCVSKHMNIWMLHFDYQKVDENHFLSAIRNSDLVKIAQFNHYATPRSVPNDPYFAPDQWNMNNTGQTGGTPGADIDAEDAWNITTGGLTADGDTIVIAIVDCGFDTTQQDINYWKDYHGTPGYPGDYNGWNVGDSDGVINNDDCTPSGHGTHVAGIAGARGNNNIGVAGVNWNVKIMPIEYGDALEYQVVESYDYALIQRDRYNKGIGNGFVVATNSSFGVDRGQPSDYPLWCAMYDSLGAVGILSAAATADGDWDVDSVGDIPTACPSNYMISVTNTDDNDARDTIDGAAYGQHTIDLGAPGTNIWSTLPGNTYGTLTGTSMSSPHVAGAVGLMYSLDCPKFDSTFKSDPAGTALLIKSFIMNSVDVVPTLANKTASGGRLNIYKALMLEADYFGCASLFSGIQNVESSIKIFTVYPNPSIDELNVKMSITDNSPVTISLTNILGQQVLVQQYQPGHTGLQNMFIDISQITQGVYFITARNGNGISSTIKVVKL